MNPRVRRAPRAYRVAGLAAGLLLSGCGNPPATLVHFDESRVDLQVTIERYSEDAATVVAEFRPTEANLHLYGQELPDGGIDGAGRPTRLVVSDPAWHATGVASSSVASQLVTLAGFDAPFATYPDGPVTLRQRIETNGIPAPGETLQLNVTFMACSSAGLCFAPVENRLVEVALD
jgi:hypothetical protein